MIDYNDLFINYKLPKPMKKEDLFDCLKQAQEGNLDARDKAIMHNVKLVLNQIMKKFVNAPYEKQELFSIGIIGLVKAIETFDIDRGFNFATYAIRCIDNEILMFIRRAKKYLKEESFDTVLGIDKDGNELKIDDVLIDEKVDLITNYENKELILEIRTQVESLEGRDKEIVKLYFGFYDDKQHSQLEIASMMGISRSYVSRILGIVLRQIQANLVAKNFIENSSKSQKISQRKRKKHSKTDQKGNGVKKLQTIYEYFSSYTKEEINAVLEILSEEEIKLIKLICGDNLVTPISNSDLTKETRDKFCGKLIPRIRTILENFRKESRHNVRIETKVVDVDQTLDVAPISSLNNNVSKIDCIKMLNLLKTPTFYQMVETFSPKTAIIISLKLGYIDEKSFSNAAIAKFLGIEETEVKETIKEVLLTYKKNIDNFMDIMIETGLDQPNLLSLSII